MDEHTAEPGQGSRTLDLGDGKLTVTIERPNGTKGSRAFAIMRSVSDRIPAITAAWGDHERTYRETHSTLVDRAYAMLRWGPQPLVRDGAPVLYPLLQEDGTPHPKAGEVIMVPSPLEAMTEEGWQARDHKMGIPADPPFAELVGVVFDRAMDVAEQHVYRVVALLTLPNAEVNELWLKGDGALDERIDKRVEELLTAAYADELMEIAVVCGEVIEDAFVSKIKRLGDRVGNALRLVGIGRKPRQADTKPEPPQTAPEEAQTSPQDEPASTPTPSTDSPPSSTASAPNTGGDGVTSPTPPMSSSSPSPPVSTGVGSA